MRRILACLLVLSMMLAFSACQNTKPAGTPENRPFPPSRELVQPDEPAQPTRRNSRLNRMHRKPRHAARRCSPARINTYRHYGMFDEGGAER